MSANGGKLIIKIDADTKGFYDKTGQINNFANTALKGIAKGAAAVGAAMVTIGTLSVKNFADYEQLVGGVDTLFKTSSRKLQEYAAEAYKTAGVSANVYMENVTAFSASLLSSLAGDTEKAAEVANMALTDMSDNSNKMGTSMESITTAYQGFAKQQYMLLDNLKLGYGGTKTEMERLLKDAQAISGVKYDIDNLADVYNAIHVIQTELGITGTTAKEATTTITGSINMAKAALDNLLVGIADPSQDIDVLVENFVTSVKSVLDNVLPRIKAVAEELMSLLISYLPEGFKTAISAVAAFGMAMVGLKLGVIANDLYKIVQRTKDFTAATKLGTAAQKLFNAELALNPYALAATAIAALTVGIATYAAMHKSAVREIRKAYDEEIKSIEETQKEELEQANTADYLRNRLFELEEQIKSGTLTDGKATKAKNELTGIVNQLNKIIPGIIGNIYDENGVIDIQRGKIDELVNSYIRLARAKAMANAYQAKLDATSKKLLDLQEEEKKLVEKGAGTPRTANIITLFTHYKEDADLESTRKEILDTENELSRLEEDYGEFVIWHPELLGNLEEKNTGIVKAGGAARTASVKSNAKKQTATVKEEAEKQEEILKEQYEAELKKLELARNIGLLTEEDYYNELSKIRDKYFDKDSEEWEEHTLEIIEARAKAITEATEELKDKQTDFADSLKGSATLYRTVNVEADDGSFSYMALSDTNAQADAIARYNANLEKLKAKGNIPDALMEEIRNMSLEDGLSFTDVLLGSPEDKFKDYIAGWQRIQDEAEKTSRMFFRKDSEELAKHTAEDFAELTESFFGVGEDGAEQFAEGFLEKWGAVFGNIKNYLQSSVSGVLPTASDYGFTGDGDFSCGNKYFTIYLTPNDDSTHTQIKAIENYMAYQNLSGGYR